MTERFRSPKVVAILPAVLGLTALTACGRTPNTSPTPARSSAAEAVCLPNPGTDWKYWGPLSTSIAPNASHIRNLSHVLEIPTDQISGVMVGPVACDQDIAGSELSTTRIQVPGAPNADWNLCVPIRLVEATYSSADRVSAECVASGPSPTPTPVGAS